MVGSRTLAYSDHRLTDGLGAARKTAEPVHSLVVRCIGSYSSGRAAAADSLEAFHNLLRIRTSHNSLGHGMTLGPDTAVDDSRESLGAEGIQDTPSLWPVRDPRRD